MPNMFKTPKVKKTSKGYSQKVQCWKSPTTIDRANRKLGKLANDGRAFTVRQTGKELLISVPEENAMYMMQLDSKGYIKQIERF